MLRRSAHRVRRANSEATMPSGACVIEYRGKRGTVWRIKWTDSEGRQIQETVGAERDGVTHKEAEAELHERPSCVERKGCQRLKRLTFAETRTHGSRRVS